jgi:two-component system KDP operon response regulator KdpE
VAQKIILIVDDEEGIVEPLAAALIHEGYRVVTAATGAEGLKAARAEKIDLAIVDVMMPPGEGLQNKTPRERTGGYVVQELRSAYPKLQVFCLSVRTDEETIQAVQRVGARFFRKGETSLKHILEMVQATLSMGPGSSGSIRRWSG